MPDGRAGRNDGSIDWLCLPRFDSGRLLCRLAGPGRERLLADRPGRRRFRSTRRRYRGDTLILETDFETAEGAVTVVDCMPLREQYPDMVRMVVGRRGSVRMRMELVVRFDYGSTVPWVQRVDHGLRPSPGPTRWCCARRSTLHGEESDDRRRIHRRRRASRCRSV